MTLLDQLSALRSKWAELPTDFEHDVLYHKGFKAAAERFVLDLDKIIAEQQFEQLKAANE